MVSQRRLVLLASDDAEIRGLLRDHLGVQEFQIEEAVDGADCGQMARELHPCIIFLDLDMPKMNGWDACRKIKALPETKKIPVVMLSQHAEKENLTKAVAAGASHYLTKPLNAEHLASLINTLTQVGRVKVGLGRGKISWISQEQGYGFIVPDDGSNKIFFVSSGSLPEVFKTLAPGQSVAFEVERTATVARAVRVKPIK